MRRVGVAGALVVALLAVASVAHAQRATERFIPLGQSPGASGKLTVIGTIVAVDPEKRQIRLEGPAGRVTVALLDSTSIWIDRHEVGLGAATGSFADCHQGRMAEVKYADPDTRQAAEWVKLRDQPGRSSPGP
jgi:hypothetical protein